MGRKARGAKVPYRRGCVSKLLVVGLSHGLGFFDRLGGAVNLVPNLGGEVGVQRRCDVLRQGMFWIGQGQRIYGFVIGDK